MVSQISRSICLTNSADRRDARAQFFSKLPVPSWSLVSVTVRKARKGEPGSRSTRGLPLRSPYLR